MQTVANEAVTLHSAALPDLVCTAITSIAPDQPIAVLPLGHPWLSLIAPARARVAGFRPNAKIVPACPTRLIPSVLLQLFNPSVLMS